MEQITHPSLILESKKGGWNNSLVNQSIDGLLMATGSNLVFRCLPMKGHKVLHSLTHENANFEIE